MGRVEWMVQNIYNISIMTDRVRLRQALSTQDRVFPGTAISNLFFSKKYTYENPYPIQKILNTLRCSLRRTTAFYMSLYASFCSDCIHSCIKYPAYSRSIGSRVTGRRRNGALILKFNKSYVFFFFMNDLTPGKYFNPRGNFYARLSTTCLGLSGGAMGGAGAEKI